MTLFRPPHFFASTAVCAAVMATFLAMAPATQAEPALAKGSAVAEGEFLRDWEANRDFFSQALERKTRHTQDPLQGLVESHTDVADPGVRLLRRLPAIQPGEESLAEYWLARAIEALEREAPRQSDEAHRLVASLHLETSHPRAQLLAALNAIDDGDFATAQAALSLIPEDSRYATFVDLNRALALFGQQRLPEAVVALEVARERGLGDEHLDEQTIVLLARFYLFQERPDDAARLLRRIEIDSPHHDAVLWVLAEDHLNRDRYADALPFLLALSERPSFQHDDAAQVALIESLARLGATRQAANLAGSKSRRLQEIWRSEQPIGKRLASASFHRGWIARQSGDPRSDDWNHFGDNAKRLSVEIERTNTLIRLIEGNVKFIGAYLALLERGDRHLVSRLSSLRNQALHPQDEVGDPQPGASNQVLWYEQLLGELVGTPAAPRLRYELLDGLSTWRFGHPFRRAWWRGDNGGLDKTQRELERLLTQHRTLRSQADGTEYVTRLQGYMNDTERQGRWIVEELAQQHAELSGSIRVALRQPTPAQEHAEHQLYRLAVASQAEPEASVSETELRFSLATNLTDGEAPRWQDLARQSAVTGAPASGGTILNPTPKQTLVWLADQARSLNIRARATHFLAFIAIRDADRLAVTETGDPAAIRRGLTDGASRYESLLAMGEADFDRGEAFYQLARAHDLLGNAEASLAALDQFVKQFQEHDLLDEVLFRRGELRFSQGDYDLAADSYVALIESSPHSGFVEEASYKLGWSHFKLGQFRKALDHFFDLVAREWRPAGDDPSDRTLLLEDAMRAISMTFANQGGIDRVNEYFAGVATVHYTEDVYVDLGHYYERKLRYSDAADAFFALTDRFPDSKRAPYYQSRVVDAYVDGDFPSRAWPAREAFVERFGASTEYWARCDEERRAGIRTWLEAYLQLLAQRDHALAQATEAAADYQKAIGWYDELLITTNDESLQAESLFLRAEAFSGLGDHARAAESYEMVSYDHPGHERAAEAGYAALLAYQELHQRSLSNEDDDSSDSTQHEWLKKSTEQSIRFIEHHPDAEQAPWVRTQLAEDELRLGRHQAAAHTAHAQMANEDDLNHELRLRLWRVVAHASFEQNAYADAEAAYARSLEFATGEEEMMALHARRAESIYRQGEIASGAGDLSTALEHYSRINELRPTTHVHANARFDEATMLIEMERWPEAIAALEMLRSSYPTHSLHEAMLEKLVLSYENDGQFDRAAGYLEEIYQREGRSDLGRDALARSARLYERAGRPDEAEQRYGLLIETFPESLEPTMEARHRLAQLADTRHAEDEKRKWLRSMLRAHDQAGSEKTERTTYLASSAALDLGRDQARNFEEIELDVPIDKSLRRKQGVMAAAIEYLDKTLDYGLAEHATEATLLIAGLYAHMAVELMESDRPADLSALESEQYEILLEEQAFPFEERAIEFHEFNVGRIKDEIYDAFVARSLDVLRDMMPVRYGKTEKVESHAASLQ